MPKAAKAVPLSRFVSSFVTNFTRGTGDEAAYVTSVLERAFDVFDIERLGGGANGLAGGVWDRVLKLTTDADEVRASAAVALRPLPHVVRIYGAWNLPIPGRKTPIGVIFMERVKPLRGGSDERTITNLVIDVRGTGLGANVRNEMRLASVELENLLYLHSEHANNPKLFRDVGSALRELREIGVYAVDTHQGNIGLARDGSYKVFDLGASSAPEQSVPTMITTPTGIAPMATEVPTLW